MSLASLILSTISLFVSLSCLVWLLAKHFSSHVIQYVDPLKDMSMPQEIGKTQLEDFRDLGDPIDQEEFEFLNKRKNHI